MSWHVSADVLTRYAGGEAGQIYRVSLDGKYEQIGTTGGDGPDCVEPARCIGGKCKLPDPGSCK